MTSPPTLIKNGASNSARWAILTAVALPLVLAGGSFAGYWQSRDARTQLTSMRAEFERKIAVLARSEERAHDRITEILSDKVDEQARIEMKENLQMQIDRLVARNQRLESWFRGGTP